jgi:hypothetical protein
MLQGLGCSSWDTPQISNTTLAIGSCLLHLCFLTSKEEVKTEQTCPYKPLAFPLAMLMFDKKHFFLV